MAATFNETVLEIRAEVRRKCVFYAPILAFSPAISAHELELLDNLHNLIIIDSDTGKLSAPPEVQPLLTKLEYGANGVPRLSLFSKADAILCEFVENHLANL